MGCERCVNFRGDHHYLPCIQENNIKIEEKVATGKNCISTIPPVGYAPQRDGVHSDQQHVSWGGGGAENQMYTVERDNQHGEWATEQPLKELALNIWAKRGQLPQREGEGE